MLKKAADLWGYPEAELDAFDPLVSLLMEACAVEFEKLAQEVANTQYRAVDQLARVMNPEVDAAKPAYGIVHARAIEPTTVLSPEAQFVYRKPGAGRNAPDAGPPEVFFSPVHTQTICNGAVKLLASPAGLYQVENGYQKTPLAPPRKEVMSSEKELWIGIQLDDAVESLANLSFFFDWQHEPDKDVFYQYLTLSQWFAGETEIRTQTGMAAEQSSTDVSTETLVDAPLPAESFVQRIVNPGFVTICAGQSFSELSRVRQLYPTALERIFSPADLKNIRERLLWLRVRFPQAMPAGALASVHCAINCFPVINRRLHKLTYRLQPNINIIPLESTEPFLAVKEVRNAANRLLTTVPRGGLQNLSTETYTLHHDLNRFDERNAREWLLYLLELVRDESMAFAALGEDFLSSVLRELNQGLARLEQKVHQKSAGRPLIPYLVIKSQAATSENVYVQYWTSNGAAANKLPGSSKLTPYDTSDVQKNEVFLVTSTFGGKDKPNADEKTGAYKRSLLTRNRVVTTEDIRAVCRAELGSQAKQIDVRKEFIVGVTPLVGFTRCIRVIITPANSRESNPADWQPVCAALQTLLEAQAATHLPIQVTLRA